MKLIVISKVNTASINIGKILRKKYPKIGAKFFDVPEDVLGLDKYAPEFKKLGAELIIIASSHKSEAQVPMLNCHTTGNWTSDDSHGGLPKTLSIAPALYLRQGILEFQKLKAANPKLSDYETGMEVTHHGPTIDFPIIFVEVGSSEKQWNDLNACEAAAEVVYKLVSDKPATIPVAIGFGGGHYCPQFNKKLNEFALGHICPKYAADAVTEEIILQAYNKTIPKPDFALIEWKGLSGPQRKNIIEVLDKNKIIWKKF